MSYTKIPSKFIGFFERFFNEIKVYDKRVDFGRNSHNLNLKPELTIKKINFSKLFVLVVKEFLESIKLKINDFNVLEREKILLKEVVSDFTDVNSYSFDSHEMEDFQIKDCSLDLSIKTGDYLLKNNIKKPYFKVKLNYWSIEALKVKIKKSYFSFRKNKVKNGNDFIFRIPMKIISSDISLLSQKQQLLFWREAIKQNTTKEPIELKGVFLNLDYSTILDIKYDYSKNILYAYRKKKSLMKKEEVYSIAFFKYKERQQGFLIKV